MIIKHIDLRKERKSSFGNLVRYLTKSKGNEFRVGRVILANLHSDDYASAILEVEAVQKQNKRAQSDKTYHYIISFRVGENPSPDILVKIEQQVSESIGFGEHQRISVVHHDTDNLHIHVSVNKIHPKTLKIHHPYNDYKTFSEVAHALEKKYGLERDNHEFKKSRSQNKIDDLERHSGQQSLLSWIRQECAEDLKNAQSWAEFNRILSAHSLTLVQKGNGFVIEDHNGIQIKASTVDRELSKSAIETRLGHIKQNYKQSNNDRQHNQNEKIASYSQNKDANTSKRLSDVKHLNTVKTLPLASTKRYQKTPLSGNNSHLYDVYKREMTNAKSQRDNEYNALYTQFKRDIDFAKNKAKLARNLLKLAKGGGLAKKLAYAVLSKNLKSEIAQLHSNYQFKKSQLNAKQQTWADWLQSKANNGDQEALKLAQSRKLAVDRRSNTLKGNKTNQKLSAYSTKTGTQIVTKNLRDDGERVLLNDQASKQEISNAVKIAIAKYGDNLSLTGTDAFKQEVIEVVVNNGYNVRFTDPNIEQMKQERIYHDRTRGVRSVIAERGHEFTNRDGKLKHEPAKLSKQSITNIGNLSATKTLDNVRKLFSRGMDVNTNRGDVLLQGDERDLVDNSRAERANDMRRKMDGASAEGKYVEERQEKRQRGLEVKEHVIGMEEGAKGVITGYRKVDNQALILIEIDEKIHVVGIENDEYQQHALGTSVTLKNGKITKTRKRSR